MVTAPSRISISLGALGHNAALLRELVAPSAAAFVVKSNGYGHGLLPVAKAAAPFASRFCVYTFEEAMRLRAGWITEPILILGPVEPRDLDEAVAAELELAVWSAPGFVRELARAAAVRGRPAEVHVEINSGLNRLGFEPAELPEALETIGAHPELVVRGIFSHLASAEEIDSPYTMEQLERFEHALTAVASAFEHDPRPLRHIAASAAAMLWPQTRLDMARFGIALYGLWPSPQTRAALDSEAFELRPALSYHSELIDVRAVEAGSSIGYGGSFHAPRAMRVGVVAAGYADGIPRALSNRGAFIVDGARCPIVGRIAMNMTEIDLAGAPHAHAGSRVTLIGKDGETAVTADDWAAWSETINYEIVARLPAELPRELVH